MAHFADTLAFSFILSPYHSNNFYDKLCTRYNRNVRAGLAPALDTNVRAGLAPALDTNARARLATSRG